MTVLVLAMLTSLLSYEIRRVVGTILLRSLAKERGYDVS